MEQVFGAKGQEWGEPSHSGCHPTPSRVWGTEIMGAGPGEEPIAIVLRLQFPRAKGKAGWREAQHLALGVPL